MHRERHAISVLGGLTLLAVAATWILSRTAASSFEPYFGAVPPVIAVLVISTLGSIALLFLHTRHNLGVLPSGVTWRSVLTITALISVIGCAVILADLTLRYPRDINVPWPSSLLFYPVMALVAEMVFHVIPLAVFLLILTLTAGLEISRRYLVLCLGLVALIEPLFQVQAALASQSLTMRDAFTALNVLVINVVLLRVFMLYGFVAMYAVRLVYYVIWHIAWGHFRLSVLF